MGLVLSSYFIDSNKDICVICLDEPKNPQKQICRHIFCKECLELMMKHNNSDIVPCPLCRKDISTRERRLELMREKYKVAYIIIYIIVAIIIDGGFFYTLYIISMYMNNMYFLYGGLFIYMFDVISTIYSLYIKKN